MSTDCENILKKFLVLNPVKRATLEVRFVQDSVAFVFDLWCIFWFNMSVGAWMPAAVDSFRAVLSHLTR